MSDQLPIPVEQDEIPELKTLVTKAKEYQPKLQHINEAAVGMMKEYLDKGSVDDEEEREDAAEIIVIVRDAYNKMLPMRKELTGPLDELKKKLMEYERPLMDEKGSDYTKLRGLIAAYDQKKIDEKKRIEEAAAKKKLRENHLVDIGAACLTNLNNLVLAKTKSADTQSDAYFKKATLENFDKHAEVYRQMKPNLKIEEYAKCFEVPYNKDLFTISEFADIITSIKQVETYEKWNEEVVKFATPVVNAWRAKIPELKENLIKLKNAADETERARLQAEQQKKADEDAARLREGIEQQHNAQAAQITDRAELSKLNNSFVEQATTYDAGDIGPTKLVLKFVDKKTSYKALSTIIYQCMSHPKFPGFEKKVKGEIVKDAQGNPEYIEGVQFWIDFFLKNCDADIPDTRVFEVAKTIIRK